MKFISTILFLSVLSACTSQPLRVNYYLLHTPALENPAYAPDHITKTIVVLEQVEVADYLRQSNLVIQVGQHELYFSRQDVWAETLQSAFQTALLQELNTSDEQFYVADYSPFAAASDSILRIKLEHFHATDRSSVVTSGKYWISTNNQQVTARHFYFDLKLEQDGYPHSVRKLRQLVGLIAGQIQRDNASRRSDAAQTIDKQH